MRIVQIDSDILRGKLRSIGEGLVASELLRLYAMKLAEKLPQGPVTPDFFVYLGRAVSTSFSLQLDDNFFAGIGQEEELFGFVDGWRSYAPLPESCRRGISVFETLNLPSDLPFFTPDGSRYSSFAKRVRKLARVLEVEGEFSS